MHILEQNRIINHSSAIRGYNSVMFTGKLNKNFFLKYHNKKYNRNNLMGRERSETITEKEY